MQVPALLAVAAFLATAAPGVLGHGYMSDPASYWPQGYASNGYGSTINSTIFGPMDNSVYGYGPEGTVKYFKAEYPDSGYNSLKDFILANQVLYSSDVDAECGLTAYNDADRSPMPSSAFTYTGFTHAGPCEFWCDDEVVAFDYDCQSTYPDIPASVPFDATKCANANKVSAYWIGVHGDPWQVYSDCSWIEGGSGSGGSSTTSGTSTTTTTAPATTTAAPAATTAAPAADSADSSEVGADADDEYASTAASDAEETDAPATDAPATDAPATDAPATEAPTPTSEKCTASARRRHRN